MKNSVHSAYVSYCTVETKCQSLQCVNDVIFTIPDCNPHKNSKTKNQCLQLNKKIKHLKAIICMNQ